jgi:hypothetical protein
MIVNRGVFTVKHPCRDEFIELVKAAFEEQDVTYRVCSYIYGPYDVILVDTEFETEEEQQGFSYDWSKPKLAEFAKKHDDLIASGPVNQLLRVH